MFPDHRDRARGTNTPGLAAGFDEAPVSPEDAVRQAMGGFGQSYVGDSAGLVPSRAATGSAAGERPDVVYFGDVRLGGPLEGETVGAVGHVRGLWSQPARDAEVELLTADTPDSPAFRKAPGAWGRLRRDVEYIHALDESGLPLRILPNGPSTPNFPFQPTNLGCAWTADRFLNLSIERKVVQYKFVESKPGGLDRALRALSDWWKANEASVKDWASKFIIIQNKTDSRGRPVPDSEIISDQAQEELSSVFAAAGASPCPADCPLGAVVLGYEIVDAEVSHSVDKGLVEFGEWTGHTKGRFPDNVRLAVRHTVRFRWDLYVEVRLACESGYA